jgi:hypothetical protein
MSVEETVNRIRAAVAELDSVKAAAVPVLVRIEVRGERGELLEVLDYWHAPTTA